MASSVLPALIPVQQAAAATREGIVPLRNALMQVLLPDIQEALLQPGGKGTHPAAKQAFHVKGSEALTKALGKLLGSPELGARLADAAYGLNEAVTGGLAAAAGRPFFSDYGYRVPDLFLNLQGQQQGVRALQAETEAQKAKAGSPALYRALYETLPLGQ